MCGCPQQLLSSESPRHLNPATQAYLTLCQRSQQRDADTMLQLLHALQQDSSAACGGGGSSAVPKSELTELDAIVSVLAGLAFTKPADRQQLVGLPGLESPQLEQCMQRARALAARGAPPPALVADGEAAAAAAPTLFAPAAGPAISLLQQSTLALPHAAACAALQSGEGGSAAEREAAAASLALAWGSPGLSQLMLQEGPGLRPPPRQSSSNGAIAAAAAARRARGCSLRRLAGSEPTGELPALPGVSMAAADADADAPARGRASAAREGRRPGAWADQEQRQGWQAAAKAAGSKPAHAASAAEAEAEGETQIVGVACVALQGVCSAVEELRAVAQSNG
jgi:hypothetical protein